MLSSHRIIKATQAYSGERASMIDTLVDTEEVTYEEEQDNLLASKVSEVRMKSEKILLSAEKESQQILASAKKEAEDWKQSAQAKGYEEGQAAGYQEGLERGFQEGLDKARQETELLKQQTLDMIQHAHEEIQQYQSDKKEELLELAIHMAEKIVHHHVNKADDTVLTLAKPYLYQLDKEEEFVTLTVHPSSRETVNDHLDEVKAICPGTRFMVLSDPNLEEQGIVIESSRAVVDLQVKKQLDAVRKELKEMERTADV